MEKSDCKQSTYAQIVYIEIIRRKKKINIEQFVALMKAKYIAQMAGRSVKLMELNFENLVMD